MDGTDESGRSSPNNSPTVFEKRKQTTSNTPIKIDPKGKGNGLKFSIEKPPQHGTATQTRTLDNIIYTPDEGFTGSDHFTYKATDQKREHSNEATVTVTVTTPSSLLEKFISIFSARTPKPEFDMPLDRDQSVESYIENRLKPFAQIFYDKSIKHTRRYFVLQMTILAASALIPIVNVTFPNKVDADSVRVVSAILGSIVLASTGLLQLTKSHESMILFRIVTSRLQREYHLFLRKIGDYKEDSGSTNKFIEKTEFLIYDANSEYADLFREAKPKTELN
jgi:Bacterial Ig domain/Protein of unknown function (DUF4231)